MTFRVGQIWRLEGPHDFMIGPLNHFDNGLDITSIICVKS